MKTQQDPVVPNFEASRINHTKVGEKNETAGVVVLTDGFCGMDFFHHKLKARHVGNFGYFSGKKVCISDFGYLVHVHEQTY